MVGDVPYVSFRPRESFSLHVVLREVRMRVIVTNFDISIWGTNTERIEMAVSAASGNWVRVGVSASVYCLEYPTAKFLPLPMMLTINRHPQC